MLRKKQFLKKFSIFELVIMAMMASIGIGIKPVIVPLAHIITGPLYIPGGVLAGGFYMLWLVLGAGIVNKRGVATIIALVQAIMVISMGTFGNHGIISLLTYLVPGISIDILLFAMGHRGPCLSFCFFAGIVANISGSLLVNMIFFKLPTIPLILTLSVAALSGGLGGIIAFNILEQIRNVNIINNEM